MTFKNLNFVKNFNNQLSRKEVEKQYSAIVIGEQSDFSKKEFPSKWLHYMERSLKAPKKIHSFNNIDSNSTANINNLYLHPLLIDELKIKFSPFHKLFKFKYKLITGRTHQIRAQSSYEGFSILGDEVYGKNNEFLKGKMALQSERIELNYQNQRLKINLDEDLINLVQLKNN